jgi:ABC-2 type transport system permease protein
MTALTRTLFGRSDLELILSSPVNARSLLAARAFSIAIDAVASVGLLLAPLANVAALRGHPHWLGLYPALIAAGLMGTGLGVVLAMGLFLAVGPRRARLLSQIAATMVGASFVLGGQAVAMLPERMRASVLSIFAPPARSVGALQGLVWTPIRAAAGDPSAMLVWAAFGVAAFAFARVLFGKRFAHAAVVAAGAPQRAGGSTNRTARFSRSAAKERRVVWRDPWLKSQLLLQAAYTMPVAVILWRSGGPTGTVGVAFTPALVVIAAQLAGALSWIALSAEDAPDFLATAPIARSAIERGKVAAIGQPIALILATSNRALLRLSLGWALRPSIRRRSDRLVGAGQSVVTGAVPSRAGAASSFAVEACRDGQSRRHA